MPKQSAFSVAGLYREGNRFRIDIRYRDPSGMPARYRQWLPRGTEERAAVARAMYLQGALPSGEFNPNAVEPLTLRKAVDEYLASQEAEGLAIRKARAGHLRSLLAWAETAPVLAKMGRAGVHLEKFTTLHVEAYRRHLRTSGEGRDGACAPSTVNRHVATIKHFARWASRMDHASREWAARIREDVELYSEADRVRTRHATAAELGRVLDGLANLDKRSEWLRPIVEFALGTGARIGEIAGLTWRHVNIERGEATFVRTKTKRNRTVKLGGPLLESIVDLASRGSEPDAFVFHVPERVTSTKRPRAARDKRRDTVSRAWARFAGALGLEDFHAHDLRHTAATRALRAGAGLAHIQKQLGHTSIRTTQRYAHVEVEDLAMIADAIAVRAPSAGRVELPADPGGQPMPQHNFRAAARTPKTYRRRPDSNRCMKVLQTFA